MTKLIYDRDIDAGALAGQRVAVIGYGSQGEAHARNLHDSGVDVVVGLRPDSRSAAAAREAGLTVTDAAQATASADVVMLLVPDTAAPAVYATRSRRTCAQGQLLLFAHGFNIHFGEIDPPGGVDVGMVAPKGPGHLVRRTLHRGRRRAGALRGAPGRDRARPAHATLAYAQGIGAARAGVLETTFEEETETDLFGEQAVLCGGVTALVQGGVRDAGRGRVPARDRLLRVPARAEADRGPDVRGRPVLDALLDLRHRRVRRLLARPRVVDDRVPGRDEADPGRDPGRHRSRKEWIAEADGGLQRLPPTSERGAGVPARGGRGRAAAR